MQQKESEVEREEQTEFLAAVADPFIDFPIFHRNGKYLPSANKMIKCNSTR